MKTGTETQGNGIVRPSKPELVESDSCKGRSVLRVILEGIEGMVLTLASLILWPILRPLLVNIGSTPEERAHAWPGDEALQETTSKVTRAVAINAPAAEIWKWLVQLGRTRAGFYSYELLENLVGCRLRNVERIVSAFQTLELNEFIEIHPSGAGFWVEREEPGHHLVFRSWKDVGDTQSSEPSTKTIWGFHLEAESPTQCRLVVVSCLQVGRPSWWRRLSTRFLLDLIDFVMEQKMLRQIRRLAERSASR